MNISKGYDFDDVLIVPKMSSVNSRSDVSLEYKPLGLKLPVIASPMKGIVSPDFLIALDKVGSMGILHRFYDDSSNWVDAIVRLGSKAKNWGMSIGLNKAHLEIAQLAAHSGAKIICLDVANGYTNAVCEFVTELSNSLVGTNALVMAGNVVTYDGAWNLYDHGANFIRVGIGSGGLCTTRNITGIGYPQISALSSCRNVNAEIISDGGIRNSGDIVKALAAGADLVMMGSLFATTFESANNGIIYGMASKQLQEEYYHDTKSIEGIQKEVTQTRSLQDLIDEISWGLKSACTYLDVDDIMNISNSVGFIEVGKGSIKEL